MSLVDVLAAHQWKCDPGKPITCEGCDWMLADPHGNWAWQFALHQETVLRAAGWQFTEGPRPPWAPR